MSKSNEDIQQEFKQYVNMTAGELEKWLQTDEARSVGIKQGTTDEKKTDSSGGQSKGEASGHMIVDILRKKQADLTDDDYQQMNRVVGYNKRHLAQRPSKEDIKTSRWRYSLMNWGYDPLKQ
jgi:hypothetical protein